ncbi:MAG: 3'-5' exonuclease, partial [Zetaproteobacteria bacterium]|nr:3'-5' exonuclease [Zetaproteobacteria bacterium]
TPLPEDCLRITVISPDMVACQPKLVEILPQFFSFIQGSVLVAHNASFDMGFVREQSSFLGYDFDWPAICTLRLAREYLSALPRKNLDTIAEHYGLSFEARHRSIGDVKVTVAVLENLLRAEAADLVTWKNFKPFRV